MLLNHNNKKLAVFTVVIAFLLTFFSISYVHPDEHFQTIEILLWKWNPNNYGVTIPWEFTSQSRSLGVMFFWYLPLYPIIHIYQPSYNPILLLTLLKLYNFLIYTNVIGFILKSEFKANKMSKMYNTLILIFGSYITVAYQSHTFSNGIETNFLLIALYLLNSVLRKGADLKISISLGCIISLGLFNRITFPGFLILPFIKVLFSIPFEDFSKFFTMVSLSFLLLSYYQIKIDTYLFESKSLVLAPLNNFLYNINTTNLSLHGLHSRVTHLLVNLPQMLGPLTLLLLNRRYLNGDTYTLSIISALSVLSIFPHQELRFLVPLYPLFCILLIKQRIRVPKLLFIAWSLFNIIMYIVMGVSHQAGNILFFQEKDLPNTVRNSVHIWWKTYSPPTWMYLQPNMQVSTTFVNQADSTEIFTDYLREYNHVVDLKGCDTELFTEVLNNYLYQYNANCVVILPSSVEYKLNSMKFSFLKLWETNINLDMDHFDFSNKDTLKTGLAAYFVQK